MITYALEPLARGVHFASLLALFGGALYPLYARTPGAPPRWAVWLAGPSALLWFGLVVTRIGGGFNALSDVTLLGAIATQSEFGWAWAAHLLLTALSIVPLPLRWRWIAPSLALVTLPALGHAAITDAALGFIHHASDAVHLLAAGMWFGGLEPLRRTLQSGLGAAAQRIVSRFSLCACFAVVAVIATGAANTLLVTGAVIPSIKSDYGALLLAKLGLVAVLLALAAYNRLALSRPLIPKALARTIAAEQIVFAIVFFVVGVLGTLAPDM